VDFRRDLIQAKKKKKTTAEWLHSITRMVKKRPGWIHDRERPLITRYLLDNYFRGGKKE